MIQFNFMQYIDNVVRRILGPWNRKKSGRDVLLQEINLHKAHKLNHQIFSIRFFSIVFSNVLSQEVRF